MAHHIKKSKARSPLKIYNAEIPGQYRTQDHHVAGYIEPARLVHPGTLFHQVGAKDKYIKDSTYLAEVIDPRQVEEIALYKPVEIPVAVQVPVQQRG